jgi:NAD(P)-dependent dehydrogenase (short-subunit alcohol dehydrogenase family)
MATFTSTYHRSSYPAIDPTAPQNSMSGKGVLLAGATAGIGLATAHAFLKASPAYIVILGRREEGLLGAFAELESARPVTSKTKIIDMRCDIGNQTHIDKLWSDLRTDNIPIDVLVLNAAATSNSGATRLQDMIPFFDMNVVAGLRMADCFLGQGPPTGKVLINVSSMAAHVTLGDQLSNVAYSASKAAGSAAFQFVADCKPVEEVQIINVHPGAILTGSARKAGYDEGTIPWDDRELTLYCIVTPQPLTSPQLLSRAHSSCGRLPSKLHSCMAGSCGVTGTSTNLWP